MKTQKKSWIKTVKIGLYRKDLRKKKANCPINKLKLADFTTYSITAEEIEDAEQIIFFDDDNTQLILKSKK